MQRIESVSAMRLAAAQLKQAGRTIALVPTSGALHAGHDALIADHCFGAEVVVTPIVRDRDGLAVTVRNRELTAAQRQDAAVLHIALKRAHEMVSQGVRSPDRVIAEVTHLLGERRRVRVIYVAMVDPATMEPKREVVPGRTLLALAVWIDEVRVIDNIEL